MMIYIIQREHNSWTELCITEVDRQGYQSLAKAEKRLIEDGYVCVDYDDFIYQLRDEELGEFAFIKRVNL